MYTVRLDDKKIYDARIDDLKLIEPVIELEENNAGSFSFTIQDNHPSYDDIKRRKSIIKVYEDDEIIFAGMVYEIEEDFYKNKKVYCEGELSYLNDTIQRPAEYHDMTVRGLLETYIKNHNAQVESEKQFKLGMVTVKDPNDSIYCYTNMETTLSCIKNDLLDDLGGIIRVRYMNNEKYIDYITEDDVRTNQQVIRLGENLINYTSNISSLDIATAIIPLGNRLEESPIESLDMRLDIKSVNDDLDYVSDSVAVSNFGWIYKTVVWDNVTDANILKNKGEKYLTDSQFDNLVIEATALDMHLIDNNEMSIRLSDKIRIVSKPHGLKDKYFRLTKQTINLNNPENNTITLGKEEHIPLSAQTVQASNDVLKAMEKITPVSSILKQAKDNATALINGNGENGYVVLHENEKGVVYEILVMDTPDIKTATKVWRWNQNGLGYANSKDANGNWKFGLAMTMDGQIVADFITSGTMYANRIHGGVLALGGRDNKSGVLKLYGTGDESWSGAERYNLINIPNNTYSTYVSPAKTINAGKYYWQYFKVPSSKLAEIPIDLIHAYKYVYVQMRIVVTKLEYTGGIPQLLMNVSFTKNSTPGYTGSVWQQEFTINTPTTLQYRLSSDGIESLDKIGVGMRNGHATDSMSATWSVSVNNIMIYLSNTAYSGPIEYTESYIYNGGSYEDFFKPEVAVTLNKDGIKAVAGEIAGFTIGTDSLTNGDSIFHHDRIGCGTAGNGIVNILASGIGGSEAYGCIQLSNSGTYYDALDGIRIFGDGKIIKYDGDGVPQWTRYLSNIPEKGIGEYFEDYLCGSGGKSFSSMSSGDLVLKR